jgi:hypothetical protein
MDFIKGELIDVIEWTDDSRDTLSFRFPDEDKAIKNGAQLIVRESQQAQFLYLGEFGDTFGPGKHTLVTDNIPVLTRLKSWKFGLQSPFKADVYFVITRLFTGNKWGTSNPVMLRDADFGVARVRSFGTWNAPDLIWVVTDLLGDAIKSGSLADLNEMFLNKWPKEAIAERKDGYWNVCQDGNAVRCLFHSRNFYGLTYRTDFFKEAGIDPSTLTTWPAFIEAAKKLTVKDASGNVTRWGFGQQFGEQFADSQMMTSIMLARQGDLDGRGILSLRALSEFVLWFLHVSLDQVTFMAGLFDIDTLAKRLRAYVERSENLRPEASRLLEEALIRGEFERGEIERITGLPERTARRILSSVIEAGLLASDTEKGPVSLRFPDEALEVLFPRLYPAGATS